MAKPTYSDPAFAERISQAIDIIGGTSETARQIGVSIPSISRWRDGTSDPSRSNLVNLAQVACVSISWLATGEGHMYEHTHPHLSVSNHTSTTDEVTVLQYDLAASAGTGSYVVADDAVARFAFQKTWLAEQGLHNKQLAIVSVKGDSMEKTLFDGDLILVSLIDDPVAAREGVCVLRYDDEVFVKRVQYNFRNKSYDISSDNKQYSGFTVEAEDVLNDRFTVLAKVERVVQRLRTPL